MSRVLFALSLLLTLGAPGLRWAADLAEAALFSEIPAKVGSRWDPNGAPEAGSHREPSGAQIEAEGPVGP